ncbi:hypothetical protein CVS40_12336 [Lucilia cuprina]|nr:hypothetical protein CVS40_12336 [Lucilia cuprina]
MKAKGGGEPIENPVVKLENYSMEGSLRPYMYVSLRKDLGMKVSDENHTMTEKLIVITWMITEDFEDYSTNTRNDEEIKDSPFLKKYNKRFKQQLNTEYTWSEMIFKDYNFIREDDKTPKDVKYKCALGPKKEMPITKIGYKLPDYTKEQNIIKNRIYREFSKTWNTNLVNSICTNKRHEVMVKCPLCEESEFTCTEAIENLSLTADLRRCQEIMRGKCAGKHLSLKLVYYEHMRTHGSRFENRR